MSCHEYAPAARSLRIDRPEPLGRGYVLKSGKSKYRDLTAFDAGGTSICYRAVTNDGDTVLIKEIYPISLGAWLTRGPDGALVPTGDSETVCQAVETRMRLHVERGVAEKGLEGELVRKGFKFFEPNYDWFEANNTLYTVYRDYGEGTLAAVAGKLTVRQAVALTGRIIEPLEELHGTGYLHLDISPENILFGPMADGLPTLKFIDLGSLVRKDRAGQLDSYPSKDGYSPFELFSAPTSGEARGLIAEHTDTFSVGAVLYNLLTGKTVNWSVCRRGARGIIPPDSPAVLQSRHTRVSFTRENIEASDADGLPPRVLRAVNSFLSEALANNPHRRFQSAAEMGRSLEQLLRYIDDCSVSLARMDMPDDFPPHCGERGLLAALSRGRTRLPSAGEMRERLKSGLDVVIKGVKAPDAREALEDYLEEYGSEYDDIVFVDETEYECALFDGRFEGVHGETKRIECDGRSLIVFCGRETGLEGGIVVMRDSEDRPRYSLSFARRPGSPPHVIRMTDVR